MLRPGHLLVACTLALLTLGVVMVNSAGMAINAKVPVTIQGVITSRSTIYLALAMLAMGLTAWFAPVQLFGATGSDPSAKPDRSGWSVRWLVFGLPVLLMLLLIVYLPGLGLAKKGASRWIKLDLPGLGDLSIQPSELVKWGMLILVAGYVATMGPSLRRFLHGHLPILCGLALVAGVMALEDLGTAILITLVVVAMLIAGGVSIWRFALLVPVGLAGLVAAIVQQPYRLERIWTYLNPYARPADSGYHMIQSMVAVHNGEIWGRGLGNGLQKFGYLPEDTTDFVFAIICEELGVFGALAVTGVYLLMLWAGFAIVRKQQAAMLKLLGFGIIATVGLQAIINIGVVTALLPTKGIALPLLSSGGTGWILTAASLGLLVAMDKLVAPVGEQIEVAAHSGGALAAIPVKESSSGTLAGA
ncbi:MAG: FtsW/RodA/SpoVE family cell cycle protein [Phycisphaerales bacterium]